MTHDSVRIEYGEGEAGKVLVNIETVKAKKRALECLKDAKSFILLTTKADEDNGIVSRVGAIDGIKAHGLLIAAMMRYIMDMREDIEKIEKEENPA